MTRTLSLSAVAAAIAVLGASNALAQAAPVVQGPEAVADWYKAGNSFINEGKQLYNNTRRAKNVILFVGDGMGVSTVTAARILEGQMKGKPGEENRLSFDAFPYTALSKTYSWDQQTSDSAPTMTAMATGYKTREGMLSVNHTTARGECNADVIDSKKVATILERAAEMGKSTGIVSTARITHATPAALYAHTSVRDWEADANLPVADVNTGAACRGSAVAVKDIARQLIETALLDCPAPVWLFCHPQLSDFYLRLGFAPCTDLPQPLAERLKRYQRSKSMLAFVRVPSPSLAAQGLEP